MSFIRRAEEGSPFPAGDPLLINLPHHTIQVRNIYEAIAAVETINSWLSDQDVRRSAQLATIRDLAENFKDDCPLPTAVSVVWSGRDDPASFGVSATGKRGGGRTSKRNNNTQREARMGAHGNFDSIEPWRVTNCAEVDSSRGRVPGSNLVLTERMKPRVERDVDVINMNDEQQQRWFAEEELKRRLGSNALYGFPACRNCQRLLQSYGSCSECEGCPSTVSDVLAPTMDDGFLPSIY